MELREYLDIIWRDRRFLGGVFLLGLALGLLVFLFQPVRFQGSLLLNIGRSVSAQAPVSGEYTYDDFYRLQADERFADTVVRWLQSPRIIEDINHEFAAHMEGPGAKSFHASRLSSQVVEVTFTHPNPHALAPLSDALVTVC
ncbi:MAG: hypothetical protein WDN67_04160 [Candidatus Moraniibacteriota bacterium]